MSENAKVVALLLLMLLALGVVGDMDYEDARRSEQALPNADLWLQRSAAAAIPPNRELLAIDDAANDDLLSHGRLLCRDQRRGHGTHCVVSSALV